MTKVSSLCVYCGASRGFDSGHLDCATRVGREAAGRGIRLVFGGGHVGLMGAVADAALAAGGEVIGVIPESLMAKEVGHARLTRLEVVDSMHTRKARMEQLSDAFCALPGGFGTLDELFEIVTWRQLGFHGKPVFLLNQDNFWRPLIDLIDHQVAYGYVQREAAEMISVVDSIASLFERLDGGAGA